MVIRVNKAKDYTVMSNYHLRDTDISLKAKGLLSQMLSLPEEWDYTVEGLCTINRESRSAIENALDELKKAGYLLITKLMPNQTKSGRIEYQYDIYEQPPKKQGVENQPLENQGVEILGVEIQGVENHQQLSTEKESTEKESTEKKEQRIKFVQPTFEEVTAYCIERGGLVDPHRWYDYYTANGWKVGRNPMRDWKASVRYWESKRSKSSEIDFEAMAREVAKELGS